MREQIAFNNDRKLRDKSLYGVRAVRDGKWSREKFCDVCTAKYALPKNIARLLWGIPEIYGAASMFYEIRVGLDLSSVEERFYRWLLLDSEFGVVNLTNELGQLAIHSVAALCHQAIGGNTASPKDWIETSKRAQEVCETLGEAADIAQDNRDEIEASDADKSMKFAALAIHYRKEAAFHAVLTAVHIANLYQDKSTPHDIIQTAIDTQAYAADSVCFSKEKVVTTDTDIEAELSYKMKLLELVSEKSFRLNFGEYRIRGC